MIFLSSNTDKHKYPIGSGRVTFMDQRSYEKAIHAAFVEIRCKRFIKKIQIDPFLDVSFSALPTVASRRAHIFNCHRSRSVRSVIRSLARIFAATSAASSTFAGPVGTGSTK